MISRQQKQLLRRELRARRRALPAWQQQRNASRLAAVVARHPHFRRARHIALYLAADGEIDPAAIASHARRLGKALYLPMLEPDGRLRFVAWRAGARLRRNRYGIGEPRGMALPWRRLDLVLMPLVGFDRRGGRLGMGGGFYDRTFGPLAGRDARWRRPALIGLAHGLQQIEQVKQVAAAALPREPWDVALAGIATERGWRRFSPADTARYL